VKAMKLIGIEQMEMQDEAKPAIEKDNDVLIKMSAVGVCGSDVHYYVSGKIGSQVVQYPFAVGHEGAGVVEEVGASVKNLKAGDRVAIDPAMSCGDCDQCKAGRHHTCRELLFLGCPGQIEGCLKEYIVMGEASCFKIKGSMTMEQAAVSEPLAIGVYSVKQSIPMQGAKVGILGAGPIGMCVRVSAKAEGAEKIYVTDKIDERISIAKKAGACWTGNPEREDIAAKILERQPSGLDVVFECCGEQDAINEAIEILKPGGKLMVVGIPQVDRISFSIDKIRRKEICIQNVRRQCDCVQAAIDMIDEKVIDAGFMVTHRFGFEDCREAFDLVKDYKNGVVKAIINFD